MSDGAGCGTTGMADCPPPFDGPSQQRFNPPPNSYVVNSKIMVVAVAVLFAVVVFILCLHVYAKWFWRNQGALGATDGTLRTVSWRRRRRVLDPNHSNNPLVVAQQSVGLDKSVIAALPVFEVDAKMLSLGAALECAVCLEEFEEGEKGRTLPKCGHHFHIECVDMWLHSHSTCPLCRASVRPDVDDSKTTSTTTTTTTTTDVEAQAELPVIGDVHAPFMAAMRASRRRQRSLGRPSTESIVHTDNPPTESPPSQEEPTSSAGDPKALALEYESIPSNVLFWGNNGAGASHIPSTQVTIDIPPAAAAGSSTAAMSPMARASANFRRLLSRGKSVVSPQDAADKGGPSSPHPLPPPPSNAAA